MMAWNPVPLCGAPYGCRTPGSPRGLAPSNTMWCGTSRLEPGGHQDGGAGAVGAGRLKAAQVCCPPPPLAFSWSSLRHLSRTTRSPGLPPWSSLCHLSCAAVCPCHGWSGMFALRGHVLRCGRPVLILCTPGSPTESHYERVCCLLVLNLVSCTRPG